MIVRECLFLTNFNENFIQMSDQKVVIELGVGVNEFKFGITRDMLKKAVGEPDEIEENDEGVDGEGLIEVWHYDDFELSVEFIEGNDWRLSTIAINSEDVILQSLPVMGKKVSEIENLIDVLNLGEYQTEKLELDEEDHEITMVTVFDSGLNFWFEGGELTEIQLMPIEEEE